MSNSGTTEVLIPRSLCLIEDIDNLIIDVEDLCSVSISWEDGFVSELKPLKNRLQNQKIFYYQDLLKRIRILINLLHGQTFLILNQTMQEHYQLILKNIKLEL